MTGMTGALTFGMICPRSSPVMPVHVWGRRFARIAARTFIE